MEDLGFLRLAAAMPVVHIANPSANVTEMVDLARDAAKSAPSIVVFPELSVCGYTCADLFGQQYLMDEAETAFAILLEETADLDAFFVAGSPVRYAGRLFNCAIAFRKGRILGIVPKTYLAGTGEFYEPRWFESARVLPPEGVRLEYAGQHNLLMTPFQLFRIGKTLACIEICQDLWSPVPPSTWGALAGAQVIINLSASNEYIMKHEYRKSLVSATSSRLYAAYIYCSCGYGESTQDLVWAGSSLIYENGSLLAESVRFKRGGRVIFADSDISRLDTLRAKEHAYSFEGTRPLFVTTDAGEAVDTDFENSLLRRVDPHPFVPSGDPSELDIRCREILSSQVYGLTTRLEHIHCRKAVIGVSGGLDSTLALLVTALSFDELGIDRSGIIGITMPGFGTTDRTYANSLALMRDLGVSSREISIVKATRQHFSDIGQDEEVHDLSYENCQARERTQILMDIAGKEGGIVVGTGDLSEIALGWCTYNGDHISMYGVNCSVPKTLVKTLVSWASEHRFGEVASLRKVLLDIIDTPISPELVPARTDGTIAQKTEDLIGPYELHDFFLYNFFRFGYSRAKLLFLARKAFAGIYANDMIDRWLSEFLKRFRRQQFKRSCMPDGPKVGSVSLSPRGDWRMPSDIDF